ncbi:hypothetical protein Hanom_Chr14g01292181 [Helianthus anomalus]
MMTSPLSNSPQTFSSPVPFPSSSSSPPVSEQSAKELSIGAYVPILAMTELRILYVR